jgi:hypothetical protein
VLSLLLGATLFATPPRPPGKITLVTNDRPTQGELREGKAEFSLPVELSFSSPVRSVHLVGRMRRTDRAQQAGPGTRPGQKEETLIDQDVRLEKSGPARLSVPVAVRAPGRYEIELLLSGTTEDEGGFSDRVIRILIVDEKGYRLVTDEQAVNEDEKARQRGFREQLAAQPGHPRVRLLLADTTALPTGVARAIKAFAVPREHQLEVRPAGLTERLRKYATDRSQESWSARDPITVRGRILFMDIDGNWKPLVNASVSVWDEDTFSDEYLGSVATDWSGNWSMSVNNDDGWFQDGRDIYYTFKLENTRWRVKSSGGDTYEWKSGVHDDLSDGSVVDFGSETAGDNTNTLQIWSTINLAWNHAVVAGGQDPGFVDSVYPSSGTFYNGSLNVLGSDNDGPDSITHEYGHALMSHAYADEGGDPNPGGAHGFGDCGQNQALSWSEGWATAFMLSARPDGVYNWHEGQPGRAIENFSSSCRTGESSEGWVAAALLDMMDGANDDNGGSENRGRNGESDANSGSTVPLATVLRDTLWGSHHNNVLEFWSSLAGELDAAGRSGGAHIMYYDWMSVLDPDACAATRVAVRQLRDPEATLKGLRLFRDHALRGLPQGRALINSYYRNSPEIALLLLGNKESAADSGRILEYFSRLGQTAARHASYKKFAAENQALIPSEIEGSIERLLGTLQERGSPELKADLGRVRQAFEAVRGRSIESLQEQFDEARTNAEGKTGERLEPSRQNPASVKALQSEKLKAQYEEPVPAPSGMKR